MTYATTAGGSAVVETLFAGSEHEMVSVYHMDGDQLVMTHYCLLGNQPTMTAQADEGDTLVFLFTGGTNMETENDPHMHKATFTFLSDDHLQSQWTMYQDGQPMETATLDLHRKTD